MGVDCDFVIRGKSDEEIFVKAAEHAKSVHHTRVIPSELAEKARAAMQIVE